MTLDLTWQDGIHINLPHAMWVSMLKLASPKGWEPAGTGAPHGWDGEWQGTYMADKVVERKLSDGRVLRGVPEGVTFTPYEVWSGKSREGLIELIGLCRKGGFTIT